MGTGAGKGLNFGNTNGSQQSHADYISKELPKSSPIKIPPMATVKEETKNGYDQVKYTWKHGDFTYTSRWHTKTPNAPKSQGNSWVVERRKPGIGYGKNASHKQEEVLVGKNKWISKQEWKNAIIARKNGTLTQQQKEWLDNGHWKDKR